MLNILTQLSATEFNSSDCDPGSTHLRATPLPSPSQGSARPPASRLPPACLPLQGGPGAVQRLRRALGALQQEPASSSQSKTPEKDRMDRKQVSSLILFAKQKDSSQSSAQESTPKKNSPRGTKIGAVAEDNSLPACRVRRPRTVCHNMIAGSTLFYNMIKNCK